MTKKKKYYYEVISQEGFDAKVYGPLKWIKPIYTTDGRESDYKWAQVIDGQVRQAFRAHEIFVTETKMNLKLP